jgi:hypothetical protein
MSPDETGLGPYVDAMSAVHDLPLASARRDEVIVQLARIRALAALVNDFELDDDLEPAPQFIP